MIRATVVLHNANTRQPENLGVINIVNDGTGDEHVAHYDVSLSADGRMTRHARIENYRRAEGWNLLLQIALGELE